MMRIMIVLSATVFAVDGIDTAAAMPPENLISEAVDASPMVAVARTDLERAQATARRLRVGDYEVQLSGAGGRRTVDSPISGDTEFTEWNAGLSRTIRLPGKRSIDKDLASLEIEKATAAFSRVRQQALLEFVSLWTDWRRASEAAATALRLADDAQMLADRETEAVALGASRQIYVDQLRAEAGLLLLEANQRGVEAENAKADLAATFPDLVLPEKATAFQWDDAQLASLMETDAREFASVREARFAFEQTKTKARRARLNRLPDPTLGVQFSNEFAGNETSLMATVSIPIGGRARGGAAAEAQSMAATAAVKLRAMEIDAARRLDQAKRAAKAAAMNLETAEQAVVRARDAMARLQEGYSIGAVNLSDLISTRRTLTRTEQALVDYRIAAESAFLKLAVLNEVFANQTPGSAG